MHGARCSAIVAIRRTGGTTGECMAHASHLKLSEESWNAGSRGVTCVLARPETAATPFT
jgi:hypothetical protein